MVEFTGKVSGMDKCSGVNTVRYIRCENSGHETELADIAKLIHEIKQLPDAQYTQILEATRGGESESLQILFEKITMMRGS